MRIKQEEQKRKATKDRADVTFEEERLALEKIEVGIDAQKAGVKMRADNRVDANKTALEVAKLLNAAKKE